MGPNPFLGVIFHWIGGFASATNFIPFRGIKRWSWEIYWLIQGFAAWIVAPIVLAWHLRPQPLRHPPPGLRSRPQQHLLRLPLGHPLGSRRHHLRPRHPLSRHRPRIRHRPRPLRRLRHHRPAHLPRPDSVTILHQTSGQIILARRPRLPHRRSRQRSRRRLQRARNHPRRKGRSRRDRLQLRQGHRRRHLRRHS